MSLEVVTGPMFSGKSTELNRKITRLVDVLNTDALIINHSSDTRDTLNGISSHSSSYKGLSDKVDIIFSTRLKDVDVTDYHIIGVDEANFFDHLYEDINRWVENGKHIVVVGLDSDFRGKKFGNIADLLPISDTFVKKSAICYKCLKDVEAKNKLVTPNDLVDAPFTEKLSNTDVVTPDIGGSDKYIPVCRKHHSFLKIY